MDTHKLFSQIYSHRFQLWSQLIFMHKGKQANTFVQLNAFKSTFLIKWKIILLTEFLITF